MADEQVVVKPFYGNSVCPDCNNSLRDGCIHVPTASGIGKVAKCPTCAGIAVLSTDEQALPERPDGCHHHHWMDKHGYANQDGDCYPYDNVEAYCLRVEATIQEQRAEISTLKDWDETLKDLDKAKLPCGHNHRYGFTDDGGKAGFCTLCEVTDLRAQVAKLTKELVFLDFGQAQQTNIAMMSSATYHEIKMALGTERTMHAAWRKRAEEAETRENKLLAQVALLAPENGGAK